MNDVLRELGGTLGVAVLGSILASKYAGGMEGSTDGLPAEAARPAWTAWTGRTWWLPGSETRPSSLVASADQAFVAAMGTTTDIASAVALVGALVALVFLPTRAKHADDEIEVLEAEVEETAEPVLV